MSKMLIRPLIWIAIFAGAYLAYSAGLFSFLDKKPIEKVTVYSHRQERLLRSLIDEFQEETGIRVEVLFAKHGLEEKIKIDGKGSNADILLTTGVVSLAKAKNYGITQVIEDQEIIAAVPRHFRDKDHHWLGLSMRARIAFIHKKEKQAMQSLRYWDLMHPLESGGLCMRDPRHPYNVALFAAMLAHRGEEETRKWLRGMRNNLAQAPSGGDRSQIRSVNSGACGIALANTYYYGVLKDSDPDDVANIMALFPTFVDGDGTHVNISGMALMKYAPHKENAQKLMRFLVSHQAQTLYAQENHEWPIVKYIPLGPYVMRWGTSLVVDPLPLEDIVNNVPMASKLVEDIFNQ